MSSLQTVGAVDKSSGRNALRTEVADSHWAQWYAGRRRDVDAELSSRMKLWKSAADGQTRLLDAVEYSLLQPGKRLRPILVLESCRVCGGTDAAAWPAAVAAECIHTFSLIHDDLPAMDDDDLRRGVPTCHKVYGEALAVLAGDWLQARAFGLAASVGIRGDRIVSELVRGTEAMIVGQGADIEGEGVASQPERVRFIHRNKTAALIESCCSIGALAAAANPEALGAIAAFGRHLGLAFQISDDLLDVTASTADLGKRANKDAGASKQTYPAAFGVDESRRQARLEIDAALEALSPFGERAAHLRGLAEFVIERRA